MRIRYSIVILAGLLGAGLLLAAQFWGTDRTETKTDKSLLKDIDVDSLAKLGKANVREQIDKSTGMQLQGRIRKYYYDWKNERGQLIQVQGDSVEPMEAPGMVEVVNPMARIHLEDGQRLEIKGEKGHIKSPRNHPESGRFYGMVTVSLRAKDGSPEIVARLDDGAEFDLAMGRLLSHSKLFVTSKMLELTGRGLDIQYNDKKKRIQRLVINHGELIKLNPAFQSERDKAKQKKGSVHQTHAADAAQMAPSDATAPAASTDKPKESAKAKKPAPPERYEVRFRDDIAISHRYGWASGNELLAFFDLSGWLNQSSQKQKPEKALSQKITDPDNKSSTAVQDNVDLRTISLFDKNDNTLALKWSGRFSLLPSQRENLIQGAKDWSLILSGNTDQPVMAEDKSGRQAKALSIDFSGLAQKVLITGNSEQPVVINDPKLGRLIGEEIVFDQKTGSGYVHGAGILERSTQHLASKTKKQKLAKAKSKEGELAGRIRWKNKLSWQMQRASHSKAKPKSKDGSQRTNSAKPAQTKKNNDGFEKMVLKSAVIEGEVTAQHERLSLSCDKITFDFHKHPEDTLLRAIAAIGRVKARSTALVQGQSELAIDSHRLDIDLFQDADSDTRIERIYATGQPSSPSSDLTKPTLPRVYARRPGERILSKQLEIYLESPGDFPPLRHRAHFRESSSHGTPWHPRSPAWPPSPSLGQGEFDLHYVRASGEVFAEVEKWHLRLDGDELITQLKPRRHVKLTSGEKPARIERLNMMVLATQVELDESTSSVHCPGHGLAAFDDARLYVNELLQHTMNSLDIKNASEVERRLNSFRMLDKASLTNALNKPQEKNYRRGGWLSWQNGMSYQDARRQALFSGNVASQVLEVDPIDIKSKAGPELTDRRLVTQTIQVDLIEGYMTPLKPKTQAKKENTAKDEQAEGTALFNENAVQSMAFQNRKLMVGQISATGQTELTSENWRHWRDAEKRKMEQRLRLTGKHINCQIPERLVNVHGSGTLLLQDHKISERQAQRNRNKTETLSRSPAPTQLAQRFKGKGDTLLSWQGRMQMDGKAFSIQMNDGVHIMHTEAAIKSKTKSTQPPSSEQPTSYEISSHLFYADFDVTQSKDGKVATRKNNLENLGFAADSVELSRIISRGSPDGIVRIEMTDGDNKILADNLIYDHERQGAILRSNVNPYLTVSPRDAQQYHARRILWDLLSGQVHILELGPTLLTNGR